MTIDLPCHSYYTNDTKLLGHNSELKFRRLGRRGRVRGDDERRLGDAFAKTGNRITATILRVERHTDDARRAAAETERVRQEKLPM